MNEAEFARIGDVAARHWWYRTLHAEVARALPSTEGARVLDVGAGAGATIAHLRSVRPDLRVAGVEPSPVGREVAAREDVTLDVGAFDDFGPHEGHAFDAVLTLDCLYYLESDARIRRAAERIASHLRPGGIWIGHVAAFPSLRGRHDAWVDCHRRFTGDELVRLFAPAGFDVTYRYRYQLLAPLVFLSRRVLERFDGDAEQSDVTLPPAPVNRALEAIVSLEDRLLRGPLGRVYGSSVLWIARKR